MSTKKIYFYNVEYQHVTKDTPSSFDFTHCHHHGFLEIRESNISMEAIEEAVTGNLAIKHSCTIEEIRDLNLTAFNPA